MIANLAVDLTEVLAQGEHVKDLVDESVVNLASVNSALKEEVSNQNAAPHVAKALAVNEATERKVEDASRKLTQMNLALKSEVRDLKLLVHQFAAATEQEQAARHTAYHDSLTDLANRSCFNERLGVAVDASSADASAGFAVMFLDLDRFKPINDAYGHDAGDAILKAVARRLEAHTRNEDTFSRYGGDEFLYVLIDAGTIENIAAVADKLVKAIQVPIQVHFGDRTEFLRVAASIGIALFPRDGSTAAELVKRADSAMFCAKHAKSGYVFVQ